MDTTHSRERLLAEKTKLEGELATVGTRGENGWEARATETGQEADPNDQAETIESYEENTAILSDLQGRYADVLAALARLEDGTYGICEIGGEPIEADRLEADPAARTCKAHIT